MRALNRSVRGFSVSQVARGFWKDTPSGRREASLRLQTLQARGILSFVTVYARTDVIDAITAPLISWEPGRETPDFQAASHFAKKRQSGVLRPVRAVVSTERAAHRFGGP